MNIAAWVKPTVWGAVLGAVAMSIVGFSAMGWVTASTAERVAKDRADSAVVVALVPFCVAKAQQDPDAKKLATLRAEQSSYTRSQFVSDAGWANLTGPATPDWALVRECSDRLFGVKPS
ncbi:MAG: hypothetical protein HYR63_29235 [Proteobacteria bacterium]|nr:hypothetical protein [Pseudomonadota bacterium]